MIQHSPFAPPNQRDRRITVCRVHRVVSFAGGGRLTICAGMSSIWENGRTSQRGRWSARSRTHARRPDGPLCLSAYACGVTLPHKVARGVEAAPVRPLTDSARSQSSSAPASGSMEVPLHRDHRRVENDNSKDSSIARCHHLRIVGRHDRAGEARPQSEHDMRGERPSQNPPRPP
jgi:hypothetical protein